MLYIYVHGNENAAEPKPVEKGVACENDPTLFAWMDEQGNIAGWAREDGTPNEYGSHVETVTNEDQLGLIEGALFGLRVAVQVCRSGINTHTLLKEGPHWERDAATMERLMDVHLQEIAELEYVRIEILGEVTQDAMRKVLGIFYAGIRTELNWTIDQAAEMTQACEDEGDDKISARGVELFEQGSTSIDFESAYNRLVPMYVSMAAMQRLKTDAVWVTPK